MYRNHGSLRAPALIAGLVLIALLAPGAGAIELDPLGGPVSTKHYASLSKVPQGGSINIAIALEMRGAWHINANRVNDEFLIPTRLTIETPPGITLKTIVYPEPLEKDLGFSDKPMLLYEGEAVIGAVLDVAADVAPGNTAVTATVVYQACDNEKCVAPEEKQIIIPLVVSVPTEAIDAIHPEIFGKIDFASAARLEAGAGTGRLGAIVSRQGWLVAFVFVYLWGLALNLTPCVYPIIPITVGYFGGQASGRLGRSLMLAVLYVLGMATMYSALGLFAALTGSILGTVLQKWYVNALVAGVMIVLATSMFGLWEIRVPMRLANLAGMSSSKGGAVGAFFMGLTVGIVAAPCIGPLVIALLTFVGTTQNPVLGFSLFFTLAIGLGTPFVILGVLSGSISKLPKSGEWMEWVKKLFGLVLVGAAIYFLDPILSDPVFWGAMGLLCVIGGILLGFVLKAQSTSLFFNVFQRFVGIAAPLLGLYLILTPGHIIARNAPEGIVWDEFDNELLAEATRDGHAVLIDFSAEWCLPCKELDHRTFTVVEVIDATQDIVRLKADLTDVASQEVRALRKTYEIRGVPTVVFIDKNGKERKDLRVLGFVDGDDFLERVNRLKSGS